MDILKIRWILVDMLLYISPNVYEPYITTYRNVINQLTTQFMSYIYGTMVTILVYYLNFCRILKLNKLR